MRDRCHRAMPVTRRSGTWWRCFLSSASTRISPPATSPRWTTSTAPTPIPRCSTPRSPPTCVICSTCSAPYLSPPPPTQESFLDERFLRSRAAPQLRNHLLRSYLQLYVTELLMKLPQLAAEKDWSALAQLYDWFCAIDAVEALRGAVAQYLKEWEHKLAEKTGIPRFIVAIVIAGDGRYAEGMDAECVDVFPRGFAVRADDPREFLGLRQSSDRTVRFPRGCENSVSERLVRFIDECVVTRGDDWVMEVMEVVSLMGQKDSFERELRHLYLRHLLQCAIMEGVSGRWRINRGGDAADRRVEEQLRKRLRFPPRRAGEGCVGFPRFFAISGDSGRKKGGINNRHLQRRPWRALQCMCYRKVAESHHDKNRHFFRHG